MGTESFRRRELLSGACNLGEQILGEIAGVEERMIEKGEVKMSLKDFVNSPLQPFWVSESSALLMYRMSKTACFAGVTKGTGFIISRLPSPHPTLINWSAPCFVTIRLTSLGFSFGHRTVSSFTACMTKDTKLQLESAGKISEAGLELAFSAGSALQDRAELIGGSCTGGMVGTVGVNKVSGSLLDFSFAGGSLAVDEKRNAEAYGEGASVRGILEGKVTPPGEMQPLYSAINTIVNHVERVSGPSRVSASLERITAGFDPERRMVLSNASVIKEEGADPSGHGGSAAQQAQQAQQGVAPSKSTSVVTNPSQGSSRVAQVEEEELERLRAAAAENAALKAQLEALQAQQAQQ